MDDVIGPAAVLEGDAGDGRRDPTWPSLADGEKRVHERLRRSAVIASPMGATNVITRKRPMIRQLVANRGLDLFRMEDDGVMTRRRVGGLQRVPLGEGGAANEVEAA